MTSVKNSKSSHISFVTKKLIHNLHISLETCKLQKNSKTVHLEYNSLFYINYCCILQLLQAKWSFNKISTDTATLTLFLYRTYSISKTATKTSSIKPRAWSGKNNCWYSNCRSVVADWILCIKYIIFLTVLTKEVYPGSRQPKCRMSCTTPFQTLISPTPQNIMHKTMANSIITNYPGSSLRTHTKPITNNLYTFAISTKEPTQRWNKVKILTHDPSWPNLLSNKKNSSLKPETSWHKDNQQK